MTARRTLPLALLLGSVCITPGASTAEEPARAGHANEIRFEEQTLTEAWRKDPPGTVPERGDTAVLTLLSDIDGFNPFTSSSAEAHNVQELIYPRLMEEQPDYYRGPPTFTPNIAASWTFGDDKRSIRFTLRECTWSDGTPITSEDVRFSWQAGANDKVAWTSRSIVDFIADVEVHTPREFTVRYTETYPYQLMDINDVSVVPRHVFGKVPFERWQEYGTWNDQARVSGGPWLLERYVPNQEIAFVPNPRYWDTGKPYLARVVFKIQGSMETNLMAVLAGGVDYMEQVLPKDAKRVLNDGDLFLYVYTSRIIGWIGWNCGKPPFDDPRVRRAMTHAIDRDNVVESVFYGYAKVAGPVVVRSMWASNRAIEPLEFDPDAAEALLDQAGWRVGEGGIRHKDGKPLAFVLVTNQGNETRKKVAEMAQASLAAIGVKVEFRAQDFNQMSQQLKRHAFDAYVGGMNVATKVDGKPIFHSAGAEGGYNYPNYRNARVDEIIDQARILSDQDVARPLWHEMQVIMAEEQPYSPLYEPLGLVALHKRFRNARVAAPRPTYNLHEWWVPKGEQRFK